MARNELQSLEILHLRGSTNAFPLIFEKGKALTIVYGENASGKSTICDAAELLGGRKLGSLEGRGLGTTTQFWPSLGRSIREIRVTLVAGSQTHVATVTTQGAVITPQEDAPIVQVLRRSQIFGLVLAPESDRFREIQRFIDVKNVETSEAALKAAADKNEADLKVYLGLLEENRAAIEHFWRQDGATAPDLLAWARALVMAQQNASPSGAGDAAILALGSAFDALGGQRDLIADARTALAAARVGLEDVERKYQEARNAVEDAGTVELLQAVSHFFESKGETPVCPVCASAENAKGLYDRIKGRLDEFAPIRALGGVRRPAEEAVTRAEGRLQQANAAAEAQRTSYLGAATSLDLPDGLAPLETLPLAVDDWPDWLAGVRPAREEWTLPVTTRVDRARFVGALADSLATYDANLKTATELQALGPRLQRAYELVAKTRHDFVDAILVDISKEVGRLYDQIHPGEGMDKISLQLNPTRRSSLKISSDFEGTSGMPPQAYFSDSHLDTLGLCIFIALAKRDNAEETILVLDDVLGSVDEPHVDRLVDLLYSEATSFRHCIITTHYKPWREKYSWGTLKNGDIRFVELAKWSAASGLAETKGIPSHIGTLRWLMGTSPQIPQPICASAGVVLESILKFLVETYRCKVPYDPGGQLTLGELIQGFDNKLRTALRVEVRDSAGALTDNPVGPHLKEIEDFAGARNMIGCHFNELAAHLPDADGIKFGELVLSLADLLVDEEVGWPRSDKSGSYWRNSKDTRRLHPLKRPQ